LTGKEEKMSREPIVAGQYYPSTSSQLRDMVRSFIDEKAEKQEAIGAVLPHAGYVYSGAVAGAVLSRVKLTGTVIIMGPSHTGRGEAFSVMAEGTWKTPLGEATIDSELAQKLLSVSRYLKADSLAHKYEHSVEVQLPFLQYLNKDIKFVPIVLGQGSGEVYKEIGKDIARTLRETQRDVLIIASSDMNHYETQEATRKKDGQAIEAMLALDEDELLRRVTKFDISMCGYAPATALISAAKELGAGNAELVKYQTSGDVSGDYAAVVGYAGIIILKPSPLVKLAKNAVETYIKEGRRFSPQAIEAGMNEQAGVFVCIKKAGELRGCIGTFEPTRKNIAEETVSNAISSATQDPRFPRVQSSELKDLAYTVDVLTSPEPVSGKEELDPRKYGVIVEAGYRRGLLLPDLEGVDTVDYQIEICRQKAGIGPDEPVKLYRFEVKRYK
jgi:MEMO1 family protein